MPTHVKRNSLVALVLLLPWQFVLAQNAPAPAPASGGKQKPQQTKDLTEIDSSSTAALDYLFNHKPGEGTAAKAGSAVANALADKIKAVDVLDTPGLDDPEVRARFVTYLSLKEVPDARIQEYFGKMAQVSQTLKAGQVFTAWQQLSALGEYKDLDAGLSKEVANHIESIWNTGRTRNDLARENDKLRGNIETYNHNADLIADDLHQQSLDEKQKGGGGKGGGGGNANNQNVTNSPLNNPNADPVAAQAAIMPTMSEGLERKMELTGEYLKLLEARANIRLNEIRVNRMTDMDRRDFSDYIRTLYNGHRYFHVVLAADFYRAIFNEGSYPSDLINQNVVAAGNNAQTANDSALKLANSMGVNSRGPIRGLNQIGNLVSGDHAGQAPASNQPMSIAEEVTSALEINHRVTQTIDVFKYKAGKGEIATAAEQLQQAFLGNEFHPALQGLSRDEKEKVGLFLAKLAVLKNQLEVRQFEQVEGQIADIKKIANDFDSTKPLALVNAVKLESRLRLGKARLLAQGGQLNESMIEFQTAAEEWPGNPDLQTSSNAFFNTEDVQNQSTTEFDRLAKDQNYRAIFDKQLVYAMAVKGDATRVQQLKDALEKVQKAEMAAQTANAMTMSGNIDGAWETVEMATKELPDDTKLNRLLANLSGRSANFVSAVNKARDAEAKKELGYSLTWYVNAQAYYPASKIANEGIDRVSKMVLTPPQDSGAPTSTN